MKPHRRYIQNLAIDKIAHKWLALLQQREQSRVGNSGISDHRFVPVTVKFQALTRRIHRYALSADDLKQKMRKFDGSAKERG